MNEIIARKLAELPENSGVYIMRDMDNTIIYVGKAVNLKNRVRSYFNNSPKGEKVLAMVAKVNDFDYIICNSEVDALVLENTLIKKHMPHYNILLKDDKLYPFLRIDPKKSFPKVEIIRRLKKDTARYFGPYMIGISASEMMDLIYSVFPIRTCNLDMNKIPKNHRPCLNYHIGRCLAPCSNKVGSEEYKTEINKVIAFLGGDDKEVRQKLTEKMMFHAEREEFELAQEYKKRIDLMEKMVRHQVVAMPNDFNLDIFGIAIGPDYSAVAVLAVRGGKLVAVDKFSVETFSDPQDIISSAIFQYYSNKPVVATEILSSFEFDATALSDFLGEKAGRKIKITFPKLSVRHELTSMADKNAEEYLTRSTSLITRKENMTTKAVAQLAEILGINPPPFRMECYDISNISGTDKVSSMVVFRGGEKAVNMYRSFRIKTVEGSNDFACMAETLDRRLARLKEQEDVSFKEKPGLIVIDGGIGQVNYAHRSLENAGFGDIPMIGLAEREETIVLTSGKEIKLPRNSFALMLLQRIRDEAHRFAITYHRKLRDKKTLTSRLKSIDGVGDVTVNALFDRFKTFEKIAEATIDELVTAEGVGKKTAQAIFDYFHNKK